MKPLATAALVLTTCLAYFVELGAGGEAFCRAYGLIPARFNFSHLLSSLFLHDPVGLTHLLGNMAFLAVFGTIVESQLGHLRFLGLYLAAGIAGGLMHVLVNPAATEPLVGASGAIFGVLAVAGAMRPRLLGFVVAFAGINIWHAFTGSDGSVSFGCHIGGFFAGFIVALLLRAAGSEALEAA